MTQHKEYSIAPLPKFVSDILSAGGLIEAVKAGLLEDRDDV